MNPMAAPYVFVDPFNDASSGITTYTRLAALRLSDEGVPVHVIRRARSTALPVFRQQVAAEVRLLKPAVLEAPETLASTLTGRGRPCPSYPPARQPSARRAAPEPAHRHRRARARAGRDRCARRSSPHRRSRPSKPSRSLFRYPPHVHCYPNPAPDGVVADASPARAEARDIDLLFLGRWQPLKGTAFLLECARRLPECRIGVATEASASAIPARFIRLSASTPAEKAAAFARARVVIVPSLFESASMVGLEAIAAGVSGRNLASPRARRIRGRAVRVHRRALGSRRPLSTDWPGAGRPRASTGRRDRSRRSDSTRPLSLPCAA